MVVIEGIRLLTVNDRLEDRLRSMIEVTMGLFDVFQI